MNTETSTAKSIEDMTPEEIEAILAKKKKAQLLQEEKKKKEYEYQRNIVVNEIVQQAITLQTQLAQFKSLCHQVMEEQAEALANYGKMPGKSKGGFSITDSDGVLRVTRRRDTEPHWDERSTKAVELIKDFLGDAIKKRDLKMYDILMSFLERNENGDMEYGRVMNLLQHEEKFGDPRWKEGLKLIKESYSNHLKGFGYEFKTRGSRGKWENLLLNFSSL
tara:strand:+ start:5834 stop:6493 length:660 start_codon:yes stop_codon:yes gene_type:complete